MAAKDKLRLPVLGHRDPAPLDAFLTLPTTPAVPSDVPPFVRQDSEILEGRALRASGYTIYVDLPGNQDEMLLVHGYSGAYDKVPRHVAMYIRSRGTKRAPRPLYGDWGDEPAHDDATPVPSDRTIETLKRRGYLTALTAEEEESFYSKIASQLHFKGVHRPPGFILMPTYQCNLRCPYCFQDHMRRDPAYGHLLRTMQPEMVDRIYKGILQIEATYGVADKDSRTVTLFGGEPLLADSRPIVEYIMQKGRESRNTAFSAITNGTDLDAYRDLLGPGKLGFLQITIDGPPAEHDRRRIYADGSGTFERIAANVTMALDLGVRISLRMNIDRQNIHGLPELAEEFITRGWTKYREFGAYVAPVHASSDNTDAKTTFNSWQLNQAMAELKRRHPAVTRISVEDDGLFNRARQVFDQRSDPYPSFKASFCGAHTSMFVIDAFGDIYACWERTGDPAIRIGAIREDGEVAMNRAITEQWRSRNVTSNPVCRRCRYSTYCGGGCAILAEGKQGTIHANYCDGFGKRFRASIAQAYLDHVAGVPRETSAERVCDL